MPKTATRASFLEREKVRQAAWWGAMIKHVGMTDDGRERPFLLRADRAAENLYADIRSPALGYFGSRGIPWHQGRDGGPSGHLCSSQVACTNFLYPFARDPEALVALFQRVLPDVVEALPMEPDRPDLFLSFEWIGLENYLGERVRRGAARTRGANCTSADAAAMFRTRDGRREIVLVEWKYGESYPSRSLEVSERGTSRADIYRPLFEQESCPLRRDLLPSYEALFYEPFYQLFRQQLLASEMERARELGADVVRLLHVAPAHNTDFLRVTSPELAMLGSSCLEVWRALQQREDRFLSVPTERLFNNEVVQGRSALERWWAYAAERYAWVTEPPPT